MNEPQSPPLTQQRDVYTVSRLNREARATLEGGFTLLWVEGELSNLAKPRSGHLYFTLKDPFAQVRCAMFRMRADSLRFAPRDGMQVLIRARVSLYEPRGNFQLIAEQMLEGGVGDLQQAFEALKQRLEVEGLFAQERKKALPRTVRRIGVVTSPSGAAIHDILSVLQRRFAGIQVILYPVKVQGEGAAAEIAHTIARAGERAEVDVLIVGRGGGSLEDLWAFNEERVARALAACPIPTVSAVGHEVDITISDFVADHRAPTPSAAAELLSPDHRDRIEALARLQRRLHLAMPRRLNDSGRHLEDLQRRLRHPGRRLHEQAQRCDELESRLQRAMGYRLSRLQGALEGQRARLQRHHPQLRLDGLGRRLATAQRRLGIGVAHRLGQHGQRLAGLARALDAVSPLATLSRGYAIISRLDNGQVVHTSDEVRIGERVSARLHRGTLICTVEESHDER